MCGPLLAKGPVGKVIALGQAAAGRRQDVAAAEAHVTDRSSTSRDGWGARLEPYHHGGPHTELKPNPSKSRTTTEV